jgi:hypothetical protein
MRIWEFVNECSVLVLLVVGAIVNFYTKSPFVRNPAKCPKTAGRVHLGPKSIVTKRISTVGFSSIRKDRDA